MDWQPGPRALSVTTGDVHVWLVELDCWKDNRAEPSTVLSRAELARASRFVFERDRIHFICGRSALRTILARYLDERPETVRFRYGSHGKPALLD
jgi:4'-phosphopantetheinyl transferase